MKEQFVTWIAASLGTMPRELITLILSMMPVSELRGAIPYGIHANIPFGRVLLIAITGNILSVIPVYFLLNRILLFLSRYRLGKKFSEWIVAHTLKKSRVIQVYEMLGLIIFVGIPLPITGAWTGTMASVLLKLKFKYYLAGITCGVLLAATIVSIITLLVRASLGT